MKEVYKKDVSTNLKFHQLKNKTLLASWRSVLAPYAREMKLFVLEVACKFATPNSRLSKAAEQAGVEVRFA
jgi:hypothetical protein